MFFTENTETVQLSDESVKHLASLIDFYGLEASDAENILAEAANIVKLNKDARLASFTTQNALMIARDRKDPIYAKYAKAAEAKRVLREQILNKYRSQATVSARKMLSNAGKTNMVDTKQSSSFANTSQ